MGNKLKQTSCNVLLHFIYLTEKRLPSPPSLHWQYICVVVIKSTIKIICSLWSGIQKLTLQFCFKGFINGSWYFWNDILAKNLWRKLHIYVCGYSLFANQFRFGMVKWRDKHLKVVKIYFFLRISFTIASTLCILKLHASGVWVI